MVCPGSIEGPEIGLTPCEVQEALSSTGILECQSRIDIRGLTGRLRPSVVLERTVVRSLPSRALRIRRSVIPAYCQLAVAIALRGGRFRRREILSYFRPIHRLDSNHLTGFCCSYLYLQMSVNRHQPHRKAKEAGSYLPAEIALDHSISKC